MRCLIYARVSSEDQVQQYGLPAQLRACRDYAKAHGYTVTEEIVDEAISGVTMDRPGLTRLRELVRSGAAETIVALDADRISRELSHLLILKPEIEKHARLEFVTGNFEDTPTGRMFFAMKGALAQYERELIRERTQRGRKEKAKAGYVVAGRVPLGYRYVGSSAGERGRYVVDDDQAAVVRQMFQWADDGESVRGIARRLNAAGVSAPKAMRWAKTSVAWVLRNDAYTGTRHYNRTRRDECGELHDRPEQEWIALSVPALVSRDQFTRVQDRIKANISVGRPSRSYLLRGLVYCPCGRRMSGQSCRSSYQYRCNARCGHPAISARRLENTVWNAVVQPFLNPDVMRSLVKEHADALSSTDGKAKLAKLRSQLERVKSREFRAVRALIEMPDYELLKGQLAGIRAQRRTIESEVERMDVPDGEVTVDGFAQQIQREAFDAMTDEQRREFIRRVVDRITWKGTHAEITLFLMAQYRPVSVRELADIEPRQHRRLSIVINAKVAA